MLNLDKISYQDKIENKEITYDGQTFNVRSWIPMEDKLALIGNIINASIDDNTFYNPARLHIFYVMNMVKEYTDIDFKEMNIMYAYDILDVSGLWDIIEKYIDENEINFIKQNIKETITNIYAYKNSVLGMIDAMNQKSEDLKVDGEALQKVIGDPENLTLVKQILDNLG